MFERKYFKNCKTAEDLKNAYRSLARKLHPDCNPDRDTKAEFQEMRNEYEKLWKILKDVHMSRDGKSTYTDKDETAEKASDFMNIIDALMSYNVTIEICGKWLYISGDTYPIRDLLKALGCHWCKKKKVWSFHVEPLIKHSKRPSSMSYIRNKYGSEIVKEAEKSDSGKFQSKPALE